MGHLGPAIVWGLARALAHLFYRVERLGPPLPEGPLLLVANHQNGLLDPAVVATTAGRVPRFLAKSTLFATPVVSWFVRGAGSIPVYRPRDEGVDASRNDQMFAAVREAFAQGEAVCVFPEGKSHSSGRVEPLRTGAARMALGAAAEGTRVLVVPIGLNFEAKTVFRSTAAVTFGPPVFTDAWVDVYRDDPARAVRGFTDDIAAHLRDLVVEAEPTHEAELVARVERLYAAARHLDPSLEARVERRRLIASGMQVLRARDPQRFSAIYEQLDRYRRRRRRFGLSEEGYLIEVPAGTVARFVVRELTYLALLGPLALAGIVLFAVPYQVVRWLAARPGLSLDQAATMKVVGGLVVYVLWMALLVAGVDHLAGGRAAALAALLLPLVAGGAVFAIERESEVIRIVRAYFASRLTADQTERRLMKHREAIAELLDETYRWLKGGPSGA